jgi:hypothetical protein
MIINLTEAMDSFFIQGDRRYIKASILLRTRRSPISLTRTQVHAKELEASRIGGSLFAGAIRPVD